MEFKSIVVALVLLAVLFGWYAWLETRERRRRRAGVKRNPFDGGGTDDARARRRRW
ncbi:MAG TPA: hypothetical protein VGV38_03295 [Pyrinomonadaceae bacterium]|nr:hypothetical protein [Pyrinomonadaceae bacterium]